MMNRSPSGPSFPMRQPPRRSGSNEPVLAVGGRVLVTGAAHVVQIALSDEHSVPTGETVACDSEVEIIAWRPRGPNGPRYRVRRASDGVEGWVDAPSLRNRPAPPPVQRAVVATPPPPPPKKRATAKATAAAKGAKAPAKAAVAAKSTTTAKAAPAAGRRR